MLYDFLVVRQITRSSRAHSVRGPKYVVKKGKTPVWSREDAKTLLDSIPKDSVSGLRDLALIAAMFYSFARVSAVLKLKVDVAMAIQSLGRASISMIFFCCLSFSALKTSLAK
jgi:site-specific recombinase XerD